MHVSSSIIGLMLAFISLSACSTVFNKRPKLQEIPIDSHKHAISWDRLDTNGMTMFQAEVTGSRSEKLQLFLAALKNCATGKVAESSLGSLPRQLFVGFSQLELYSQSSFIIGDYQVEDRYLGASLESTPLIIRTYAFLAEGCTHDVVFWSNAERNPGNLALFDSAQEEMRRVLSEYVQGLTSG